jgi:DinB superfamily
MTPQARAEQIEKIRRLPSQVAELVQDLTPAQLTTHYLPKEWTVAQNVHHLVDSHMNSYIRCKLIATEEQPPLKPYDQDQWANFADANSADLTASLALLKNLHARWVIFWETLPENAWVRIGIHAAVGPMSLEQIVQVYAEHGEEHLEQMTRTLAAA